MTGVMKYDVKFTNDCKYTIFARLVINSIYMRMLIINYKNRQFDVLKWKLSEINDLTRHLHRLEQMNRISVASKKARTFPKKK